MNTSSTYQTIKKSMVSIIILMMLGSAVNAAPRRIAASDGMVASVSDRPDWCQQTVFVSIKAPTTDVFAGAQVVLRKFLEEARSTIERECPKVEAIRLTGVVDPRGTVFMGTASKNTGWELTSGRSSISTAATGSTSPVAQQEAEAVTVSTPSSVTTTTATGSVLESGPTRPPAAPTPIGSLTPIQLCDRLAAHPDDPEAFSAGVTDEKLQAKEVISACEQAINLDKNAPRLSFQLARGYLKSDRIEEAIEQLISAAKQGHGASLAYLGDIHLDGGPGIEADPALAHSLYTKALAAGFEPARTILAQFEDYTEKSAAADQEEKMLLAQNSMSTASAPPMTMDYINPDIIENILRGDLDEVSNNESWVKNYLVEVADNISQECKKHFTIADIKYLRTTAAVKGIDTTAGGGIANMMNGGENIVNMLIQATQGGGMGSVAQQAASRERDAENISMKLMEEGIKDSFILIMRHPCGSTQLSSFSKNLTSYIEDAGAPRQSADQLLQSCQRTENKNRTKEGNQLCLCIARKLIGGASMTRGERKELASDFHSAAQRIIDKNKDHFRSCF